MYPELYKCNLRESTFVEFCVDGINLYDENNFIDSLGLGRDSNPDSSPLKPSECTTTPLTSSNIVNQLSLDARYSPLCVTAKVTKFIGLNPPLFLSPTNLVTFASTQNDQITFHIKLTL
jgi:hypothetical protein